MSESESTSASTIVRQTRLEYEEMRRKLAETEQKLNRLARLEARDQTVASQNAGMEQREGEEVGGNRRQRQRDRGDHSSVPEGSLQLSAPSASMEDIGSVRSELSTVPGSYTGFASRPVPASTPSKKAALPPGNDQIAGEDLYDSDSSGSLRQAGNTNISSNNSVKLLRQNQRLLSEVERLVCELQAAKHREGDLRLELESSQGQGRELQERSEELKAEIEAQDKALRSAEQHLSESQRQTAVIQQELSSCQQHLKDLRLELEEEKKARNSVETQRDEAVQNFLETQTAFEDFQRRNHERMKTLEESEEHLRDSLAHTNSERDELLQKVDALQGTVTAHEAEIERLQALNAMEQETKQEMETTSLDLRRQLAKLTTRLHKAEEEGLEMSRLRQENAALLSEVEECRDVISQLEDMADHLRQQRQAGLGDDSGNFSIHLGASMRSNAAASNKTGNSSCSRSEGRAVLGAEGNTNNNGSSIGSLLIELRQMLYEMDEEIRRLRLQVHCQEDDQQAVEDLRSELTLLMTRAKDGERQTQELEVVVGKLEKDNAAKGRQVQQLEEELTCRDSQLMTVEARLAHRNAQIIDLQEDANRRCEDIARLEKESWKKSSAISQLESELEEQKEVVNGLHAQLTQARHDTGCVEEELRSAHSRAQTLQMDLERSRKAEQDSQGVLASHCRHYEHQLDKLRKEAKAKENMSMEMQHMVKKAQTETSDRDRLIRQLETTLLELEKKLSEATKHSKECQGQMEAKLTLSLQQNSELESALILCRNEIAEHLTSMERTREKFDTELGRREQAIERLEDQVRALHADIQQHADDNVKMERELAEKRTTVQHLHSNLAHLEQSEKTLKDNVQQLEQQLMREKGQWMMESDELERKLGSQSAELDSALAHCNDLKHTVKELQEELRQTESERVALERALQSEKKGNNCQTERILRLEKDLRDIRVELEQKIEMVSDLEDVMRNKDADLEQQRSLVEQLDVEKLHMQRELKQLEETKAQLEESVGRLQFDGRAKEQILSDTREVLRKTELELSERTTEASHLNDVLEERQRELEDRLKSVQGLEHTIAETQVEMSQRMQRVDHTLQKYEKEIMERTAQIADLDDRLKETQKELLETSLQLQHQKQLSQHQHMELQAASAKVIELENTNARQKQRLEEQKQEIVDITQDMRLTREQHQTEHMEFLSLRRDLASSRREVERLVKELEEREAAQQSKERDTARLSEELGSSQARAAQSLARLTAMERQHERDVDEVKDKYQKELDLVIQSRDEVVAEHAALVSKLRMQMGENEQVYDQRLDSARCELDALRNELSLRRELIRNANDTICMKDQEIANLKAQVSFLERQNQQIRTTSAAAKVFHETSRPHKSTSRGHRSISFAHLESQEGEAFHAMTRGSEPTHAQDNLHTASSHHLTSSGSDTPLTRRDLNHNNANLNNATPLPYHSINELPMKDTWEDKEHQDGDYATDRLIFSFEKLSSGLSGAGGNSTHVKDVDGKGEEEAMKSDTVSKPPPPAEIQTGQKDKKNLGSKKGGGGVRTLGQGPVSAKAQAAHCRTLSAPLARTQGLKVARRKAKPGGAKVPVKKWSGGKGERGDFSHHYKDPETLVGTYKGGASPSMPQKEMEDLQQQLQVNALRQQEIERQLLSLDDSSDGEEDASDDLIDLTSDPQ